MAIRSLPSMETTFSIKVKGTETGELFEGSFTYRRPNLKNRSEISKTAAMLDGGLKNLDDDTKLLHSILATLKHTLTSYPDWWVKSDFGFELYDLNAIFEIYKACNDFENKWFKEVWKEEETKDK